MIPRIVHQTYPSRVLPPFLKEKREELMAANRDWKFCIYDDADISDYIYHFYGPDMNALYQRINPAYGAARADLFRYLVMFHHGGVYLDIKSTANVPLSTIIPPESDYVLGRWPENSGWGRHPELEGSGYGEFQQWFIVAKPLHEYLAYVIAKVVQNINLYTPNIFGVGKLGVLRTTGPIAYTQAILEVLKPHHRTAIVDSEKLGLKYSVFASPHTHERIFEPHYSRLTSPIILK